MYIFNWKKKERKDWHKLLVFIRVGLNSKYWNCEKNQNFQSILIFTHNGETFSFCMLFDFPNKKKTKEKIESKEFMNLSIKGVKKECELINFFFLIKNNGNKSLYLSIFLLNNDFCFIKSIFVDFRTLLNEGI